MPNPKNLATSTSVKLLYIAPTGMSFLHISSSNVIIFAPDIQNIFAIFVASSKKSFDITASIMRPPYQYWPFVFFSKFLFLL